MKLSFGISVNLDLTNDLRARRKKEGRHESKALMPPYNHPNYALQPSAEQGQSYAVASGGCGPPVEWG